jgi:oligopeptide/dipeptide ABC transporter ATP-binding protein
LLSAIPVSRPAQRRQREIIKGDVPSPIHPPSGCRFRTRCPLAQEICAQVEPPLQTAAADHEVACHFALPGPEAGPAANH